MEWIYGIDWLGVISGVILAVFAYFFVKGMAEGAVNRWVREKVSPGVGGQRSIVYPRVWTFTLSLSDKFLEGLSGQTATSEESDPGHEKPNPMFLLKLVIEEYATRIRVHRWYGNQKGDQIFVDNPRYDWRDIAHHPHWIREEEGWITKFTLRDDESLWSYDTSTDEISSTLTLSGAWKKGADKDRRFFQLTLWVERFKDLAKQVPPSDVLFEVPLDPGLLDDQRGHTVIVPGRGSEERKASEVLPYPMDEGKWEGNSGEAEDGFYCRWAWYLIMQTFDKGSFF